MENYTIEADAQKRNSINLMSQKMWEMENNNKSHNNEQQNSQQRYKH